MIDWIDWPKDLQIGTFRSKTCLLYEEDVQKIILPKNDDILNATKKVIKVKILDISWLCQNNKSFPDFVTILTGCERNSIFSSEMVTYLLNEFWEIYQ